MLGTAVVSLPDAVYRGGENRRESANWLRKSRTAVYEKNECRESCEVSTKGEKLEDVLQGVEKLTMKLVTNENGSA